MDQVKIRASVAAGGLRKNQEVTVAATPMVEGGIRNGVFVELERYPAETPVPPIEEVELPDAVDTPKPETPKRRG